ncbi:MAG: hypothetical protein AB1801_16280 [Chloroflexota bacterium]
MLHLKPPPLTEARLYAGFNRITQFLLKCWKDRIIEISDRPTTLAIIEDINHRLLVGNAVVFFDHHYAFDAIPASLVLGQMLQNVTGALIPYAVHLDMGIDPEGLPSLRYRLRTLAFHKLIKNIQKANPTIYFFPVVRQFELETPRLRAIVDSQSLGANTKYLKTFHQLFVPDSTGQVCILSPMAGIAFPEKPALHPTVYRSMEMVQDKWGQLLPFYFVGAYPRLHAHYHYLAPLLSRHTIVARGPFYLPAGNYEQALEVVAAYLNQLRRAAQFTLPNYDRISHK